MYRVYHEVIRDDEYLGQVSAYCVDLIALLDRRITAKKKALTKKRFKDYISTIKENPEHDLSERKKYADALDIINTLQECKSYSRIVEDDEDLNEVFDEYRSLYMTLVNKLVDFIAKEKYAMFSYYDLLYSFNFNVITTIIREEVVMR